jgi:hypothetical protein
LKSADCKAETRKRAFHRELAARGPRRRISRPAATFPSPIPNRPGRDLPSGGGAADHGPEPIAGEVADPKLVAVPDGLEHPHAFALEAVRVRLGDAVERQGLDRARVLVLEARVADVRLAEPVEGHRPLHHVARSQAALLDTHVQVLAFTGGRVERDLLDPKVLDARAENAATAGQAGTPEGPLHRRGR